MNTSAFSLLELLVVISISSILAIIGVASWQDLQHRDQLSMVTLNILQFLHEVKSRANDHNINQYVYLIKKNNHDSCIVATDTQQSPVDCVAPLKLMINISKIRLEGLSNQAMLAFYGRHNTAKGLTISLKNSVGETRIIISVPGRIRYCSYHTDLVGFTPC